MASPGGHLAVGLFIVMNGIALLFFKEDAGKLILGEGLGATLALIRPGGSGQSGGWGDVKVTCPKCGHTFPFNEAQ